MNISEKPVHDNVDDSWLVAYHGTHPFSVNGNTHRTKSMDPGTALYVTRHCNGGADQFTTPFALSDGDHHQTFRMIFQCRVKPDSFLVENNLLPDGDAWLILNLKDVQPDGFLLKNDTLSS